MSDYFQFAEIGYLENATFDNSLDHFHRNGIRGTIKENIQNALDARVSPDTPVKVTIKLGQLDKEDLPGINEVFNHIHSLKGQNGYTIETIEYMQSKDMLQKVPVISFEDSNSKGLTGAKNGQSNNRQDTYGIYAYNKGVHFVEEDQQKETTRGGSHGIGKIANNAASDIHLMYFANCDEEGNQHLGGTIQLIEHRHNDTNYRATGYYSKVDENSNKLIPFENYSNHSIFKKDTRGLKIIIPYVRKEFMNKKEIINAICDNFFLAILKEELLIDVYDENDSLTTINSDSIKTLVKDNDFYETEISEMKKVFTPLYVETFVKEDPIEFKVSNNSDTFNFNLYFKYDPEIPVGRVGLFRTIGMKIEDFGVNNNKRKPFNAVLVGGLKEDGYLKSLENESHTKISPEDIRDELEKKNARKFINNLHKELSKIIDEAIQKNNPTDGLLDTSDLIYETESSFKRELENRNEKVIINDGKTIYKRKEKETRKKRGQSSNQSERKQDRDRKPRKVKSDNDTNIEQYITPTDAVNRLSVGQREIINIDLDKIGFDISRLSDSKCNVTFNVVDGDGKTSKDEFNFDQYVRDISDHITLKKYNWQKNKINEVILKDNQIQIIIEASNANLSKLKFMYEVEVSL